jgi:transposase-like protein
MTEKTSNRFSPEVRQRAVRMVLEHGGDHASQRAAIGSIAAKIGCTAETLRKWVRQAERDEGLRAGPTTAEQDRIKVLERENRELRQAKEILRKASAHFCPGGARPPIEAIDGNAVDRVPPGSRYPGHRQGSPSSTITGARTGSSRSALRRR